jgi:hypothetical protein
VKRSDEIDGTTNVRSNQYSEGAVSARRSAIALAGDHGRNAQRRGFSRFQRTRDREVKSSSLHPAARPCRAARACAHEANIRCAAKAKSRIPDQHHRAAASRRTANGVEHMKPGNPSIHTDVELTAKSNKKGRISATHSTALAAHANECRSKKPRNPET